MTCHFLLAILIPFTPCAVLGAGDKKALLFFLAVVIIPGILPLQRSFDVSAFFFYIAILKPKCLFAVFHVVGIGGLLFYFSAFKIQFPDAGLFSLIDGAFDLPVIFGVPSGDLAVEDAVLIGDDSLCISIGKESVCLPGVWAPACHFIGQAAFRDQFIHSDLSGSQHGQGERK